jgi:positive regulator of sigma E activity
MNEHEEDLGIVTKIEGKLATVVLSKSGACDHCAISGICMGKNSSVTHQIETEFALHIGDTVRIFIEPKYKLLSSFLVFIFPIIIMILAYLVSFYVFQFSEKISIGITLCSFLVSGLIVYFIDKKLQHKLKVKILEKVEK